MVVENYRKIEERVQKACERAGRDRSEVTLIAVSKTKPDEMVHQLVDIGVRDFGENKPQELMRKHDEIAPGDKLNWHMIGNLQTNKVKQVVGRAKLIHSVPSLHTAQAVSKYAEKIGETAHILIEVNIANEATKHGAATQDVPSLVKEIASLSNIEIMGLMAIAPFVENPEENRENFKSLRELRDKIKSECEKEHIENAPMTELSMGMTADFEVAIEEGATYIRVGTAIFGERDYSAAK